MKLLDEMVLVEVAGEYMVVPTAKSSEKFSGVVRLNVTGKDIWEAIGQGMNESEIARMLTEKYAGVDEETALKNVKTVVDTLKKEGLLYE